MNTLLKLGLLAGAAYGGYVLYKKYVKEAEPKENFCDSTTPEYAYDEDAAKEQSFEDKIRAAANRHLDKLK